MLQAYVIRQQAYEYCGRSITQEGTQHVRYVTIGQKDSLKSLGVL